MRGGVNVTLGNTVYSSCTDDSHLPEKTPRKVSAYSLWDVSASWRPMKALTLRAGVLNVLDRALPLSNQSDYFLSTCDPTYTDPRGRTAFVSLAYSFR